MPSSLSLAPLLHFMECLLCLPHRGTHGPSSRGLASGVLVLTPSEALAKFLPILGPQFPLLQPFLCSSHAVRIRTLGLPSLPEHCCSPQASRILYFLPQLMPTQGLSGKLSVHGRPPTPTPSLQYCFSPPPFIDWVPSSYSPHCPLA